MEKLFDRLIKGLGSTKFSLVYALIFASLINSIASIINGIMRNPPYTFNTVLMNLAIYFALGVYVAKQIIKKNEAKNKKK